MQKVTITNGRGESLEMGLSPPFILCTLEGTGGNSTNVIMKTSPFQDGATYIGTFLEVKDLHFQVDIYAETPVELFELREQIARIVSAKSGLGNLVFEYPGGEKQIEFTVDEEPAFLTGKANRGPTYQRLTFSLVCPDPYWKDKSETIDEFISITGGLEFPIDFPSQFGEIDVNTSKIIVNKGNAETPIKLVMDGPLTSPIRLTNETTGQTIEVKQDLLEGEKLVVITAFGKKRVEKIKTNGEVMNAFNYINFLTTEFWSLQPGNNLISYSTGIEGELSPLYIEFNNKYTGV
ncbi:phage distal tail protein [Bacillus solitudinis]|uniref:phage distal tail protein n=1 Tax=Bacillus solitudinis TaxID=2014074 RepID=UPI000C2452B3|nr:phage tail domain-containing protein [Bacillus solitudinis]